MSILDLPPIGLAHFAAGTIVVLAGIGAFGFRKGSPQHKFSGHLFTACMLLVSISGLLMSISRSITFTIFLSILAVYLVSTGWLAARTKVAGLAEKFACLIILVNAVAAAIVGRQVGLSDAGELDGLPAGAFYTIASISAFLALLDINLIKRGSLSGKHRIARHLWRMNFSMLIGVTIFFLGNNEVLPDFMRQPYLLIAPIVLVQLLMIFWLLRVLIARKSKRRESQIFND